MVAPLEPSERLEIAYPASLVVPENELIVDRLRIAFGVNDTVIRHLFSIGLELHTTRAMVSSPAQVRLDATIDELDLAINELRTLIFDLERRASGDLVECPTGSG